MPKTLYKLFKGQFNKDLDSSDFVQSGDKSILHMKYVILQSLRIAFHYCVDAFIMGEFDVPTVHADIEVSLGYF